MKIFVKTLKGTHFEIQVKPEDTVADVKKNIETVQGAAIYPAEQQMIIHQGKVLKDDTTLEANQVAENSFVVVMLSKTKTTKGEGSAASATPTPKAPSEAAPPATVPSSTPVTNVAVPSVPAPAPVPVSGTDVITAAPQSDVYGQAASNIVAGNNFEQTIQQILDMGGGTWDRDTVARALRAAYNNPERAVEYLYSGIPEQADAPLAARNPTSTQPADSTAVPAPVAVPSGGPNVNPLDLFPQGLPNLASNAGGAGNLEFLRNSEQFQALRAMVQADPRILQPMLQELMKQNPNLMRLIQEHQADFVRLINDPGEGGESDVVGEPDAGLTQAIEVTPEEREAIERLEAMGFDQATVLEVYFACNRDEELAANYLLDHMHEFED